MASSGIEDREYIHSIFGSYLVGPTELVRELRQRDARIAELEAALDELRAVVQSPDSLDYGDRVVVAAAKACRVPNPYTGPLDA